MRVRLRSAPPRFAFLQGSSDLPADALGRVRAELERATATAAGASVSRGAEPLAEDCTERLGCDAQQRVVVVGTGTPSAPVIELAELVALLPGSPDALVQWLHALRPHLPTVVLDPDEATWGERLREGLRRCPDVLDATRTPPGWLHAMRDALPPNEDRQGRAHEMAASSLQTGAGGTWVYRAWRPMHPERLHGLLVRVAAGLDQALVRVKGYLWLANVFDHALLLEADPSGGVLLRPSGRWWATRHPIYWPAPGSAERAWLDARWQEPWGDRRQELALLGELDAESWKKDLDDCLLRDAELRAGQAGWQILPAAFGTWPWRAPATPESNISSASGATRDGTLQRS